MYLQGWLISAEVKLRLFQKSILDHWRWSQGVEDGEKARMVAGYSMQSHGASLVFLRTPGEVISEEIYFGLRRGHVGKWLSVHVLSYHLG